MAPKRSLKKDFSKEAMYRKIMPSITTPIDLSDDLDDPAPKPDGFQPPEHTPFNVMELVIRAKVPGIMETLGACSCERCRNDSIALALNAVPQHYMVADAAALRDMAVAIRTNNEMKITAAVIRSVQAIMANPRH